VRTVLLGDSHLARLHRELRRLPGNLYNVAEGGACSLDLLTQAAAVGFRKSDTAVVSVGTNDAAPWKQTPVSEFAQEIGTCLGSHTLRAWVYIAPPGVVEGRLTGEGDRTNAVIHEYRRAAIRACAEAGAQVIRADLILEPLGAKAFAEDGIHLSGSGYRVLIPAISSAIEQFTR